MAGPVDVLTLSDLRLPGGTSHSNAEEVQAQFRLGLRTELVQLNGSFSAVARGLNPRLENLIRGGQALFAPTPTPRKATAAILRHPGTIASAVTLGPVEVEHLVLVVNANPIDWNGREHWRPEEVHGRATTLFGVEPLWAPIGPNVREALTDRVPGDRLRDSDWVNIIDVDHWWVDRSGRDRRRRPVVGRHSRASVQKWPKQPERDLVYPPDGRWDIRVLGWDPIVQDTLGPPPASWSVHRFGTVSPREFLAGLDFFVYFHNPRLIEAFGRTVLEAIASGVPAILPPHFEPTFGSAAIYAEPSAVADVVEELWADEQAYQTHINLAQAVLRHRFSYQTHARRLSELLEQPQLAQRPLSTPPGPGARITGTVLLDLCGTEESHRQAEDVLGPKPAVAALTIAGAPSPPALWTDRLPTESECGLSFKEWEAMAARRVSTVLRSHPGARAVVVTQRPPGQALQTALDAADTSEVIFLTIESDHGGEQ